MTTTETTTKIGKGTKFHATYQDGNPEWSVTKSRGRGVFEARIVDERCFGAVTKVFTTEEINRSIAMSQYFSNTLSESDRFYASLTLGQVVHYHNSFGKFIRCVVVDACLPDTGFNKVRCLMPIALVGPWHKSDLPKRRPNGEVYYGYNVDKIRNQEPWKPNYQHIYESGAGSTATSYGDPSKLPEVDLTLPELTAEEQATAALWAKVDAIRTTISSGNDPAAILEAVRAALG
jgi:hypothetical protein